MPTLGEIKRREEQKEIERARKRDYVRDLRRACKVLFEAGAGDAEVDDILTDRPVPMNPDLEWAQMERSRYLLVRLDGWRR